MTPSDETRSGVARPQAAADRGGAPTSPEMALVERFHRAAREPRLMMLYPPISTGRAYDGTPDAAHLWAGCARSGTLYVHVPYCPTRCAFCPFYAVSGSPDDYEGYADSVLAEARLYAPAVRHVAFSSVYFGGGTPTVLPAATLGRLLDGLSRLFRIGAADVTAEAHPSTVDRKKLGELRAAGVTRLSIGVESFDPVVLRAAGRADTAGAVVSVVRDALDAGFHDVNVDLMYGLPEQSLRSWREDLRIAADLGVPGLTLYSTVYLPAFQSRCEAENFALPGPSYRTIMYDAAYEFLSAAGYPQPHYGAGAFRRGELNRHRENVSLGLPTLGLGTWAYSSNGRTAYHNQFPIKNWSDEVAAGRLPIRQVVAIPEEERARKYAVEALLLAYVSLSRFRTVFGVDFPDVFRDEIAALRRLNLATIDGDELVLTRRGGRHLREVRYLFASREVVAALEEGKAQGL